MKLVFKSILAAAVALSGMHAFAKDSKVSLAVGAGFIPSTDMNKLGSLIRNDLGADTLEIKKVVNDMRLSMTDWKLDVMFMKDNVMYAGLIYICDEKNHNSEYCDDVTVKSKINSPTSPLYIQWSESLFYVENGGAWVRTQIELSSSQAVYSRKDNENISAGQVNH